MGGRPPLDRWLRLAAPLRERYDAENSSRRKRDLQSAILVGLLVYNIYNFTSIVLLPDLLTFSVILRLAVITPLSLGLAWAIGRTSPYWTEWLVTGGLVNSFMLPIYLLWATKEPLGLFTFGELPLTIIFGCVLLGLRFPNAIVFTSSALALTCLGLATKEGLETSLAFALALQFGTACAFGLVANYRIERRRCSDYLQKLAAILQADNALAARQAFQALSQTDELTQLPNRRHLTETLEKQLAEGRSFALMMIDIDHFKSYNDTLGHPAGDACLRNVANALARAASDREGAFCARFGGEEFTFVSPCSSEVEAARAARSLVQAISALKISHPSRPDQLDIVTASIGVAFTANGKPQSLGDLLIAADRALYRVKRGGRNGYLLDVPEKTPKRRAGDEPVAVISSAAALRTA
ncbi:GGDEF domain-containing protein [Fulvimarina sp. MAC3]|uniref:GGDEF domain-containing protein n=1 Tax=Fulvimarina sp. MAC3 TaxID=3148887 RepID=UPI0031FBFA08